ncbi:MAG: alpha/beta hydrolase [Candidatus Poseidoniaceae archaeon]
MPRRKATWDGKSILTSILITSLAAVFLPYGFIFILLLIVILVHQSLLRIIFSGPSSRSDVLSEPGWDLVHTTNDGVDVYGFSNFQSYKADLVVFIHGWQSSSDKFIERMKIFQNKGLHTLAIDMRGHGIAPATPEWTAGKVIGDVKSMLSSIDNSSVKNIHFYGHSLGAFICLGMQHERHQGWWKERCSTIMLESPMVAYSPIMEEMSGKISFMLPLLKRWALKGFKKIHPEIGELEWKDIDIPSWGLPKVPILLLQSANDRRLGRFHYDLLLKQDVEIYPHLIESLTHSKNRLNKERDDLIINWIESRIL